MNKLLITGGSGFIGTNLIERLSKRYEILNLDIQPPKIEAHRSFWMKTDIRDFQSLQSIAVDFAPDYIIHLGGRTDLNGKTIEEYDAAVIGCRNLIQIAESLKGLKKILFTSSMLVCQTGYYPKHQRDYNPSTLYGESKVEMEKTAWSLPISCDWVIIRPTSIWGPWFGEPYRDFFDRVRNGTYFHIGRKGCTKTYGYVGNAIYQIEQILLADTRNENRKVFYIGDTPGTPIEAWADEIAGELGKKIVRMPYTLLKWAAWTGDGLKTVGIRFPMTSFRLKNMTTDNIIDLSETMQLAPNPPYTRVEGIKETLDWLKTNNHSINCR